MKHKTAPTISLAGWFTTDRTVDAAEVPKTGTIPADVWVTGAPLLWNSQTPVRGTGVIVGVIDSGIDDAHPDLRGKVLFRKDYVKDGASPDKFNLHGTHVAGTIAANGKVLGVAPGAVLHDYRVLGQDGSGSLDSITQAVRDAVKHGCNILNLSLGGPSDYPPLHQAIKAAVQAGVLVVCAAGNEGEGAIGYPAFYEEVVSVGAVDFNSSTGRIDKLDFPSQNEEVDVAADGYQVFSTVPGGKYAFLSGTSMASPHVAGFAALMLNKLRVMQALPRSFQSGLGSSTEPILYTLIKESTVDILGKGIDWGSGAGFVTWYPAVPTKDPNGKWILPGMELGVPQ